MNSSSVSLNESAVRSGVSRDSIPPSRRRKWLYVLVALVVVVVVGLIALYPWITEEIAYVRGIQAYVYGFPLVLMDITKGKVSAVHKSEQYYAPINQFFRMRTYVDPDYKDCVRISRNSLWSAGYIDLETEPIVYSQPDTHGRYIVMQALNMWTDDFASVGSRTTGTGAGSFLIAGPKWNGTPPADVKGVYRSTTRYAAVLVQIYAASPSEFSEVNALSDKLNLTPLSAWGKPYTPPDNVPIDPTVDTTATPYDQVQMMDAGHFFQRLAILLKDNPPYPADAAMLDKLKKIGVEPGKDFDIHKLDPAIQRGLNRAPWKVWDVFRSGPYEAKSVNGWIQTVDVGTFETDYNNRAFLAYFGLGALTKEDAAYPSAFVDGDGRWLYGDGKYVMHFDKGQLFPSFSGVWSISPYRGNFYVHNPIERYAISSGMPLKYNPDGSLDVYIQADSPGADKESNWLPVPKTGPFNLTVRVYQPKPELFDGKVHDFAVVGPSTYNIPPVKRVD
ncbi:MAG TPA: DUF1254 domain-containing protein [Terriglobales bacterium]